VLKLISLSWLESLSKYFARLELSVIKIVSALDRGQSLKLCCPLF